MADEKKITTVPKGSEIYLRGTRFRSGEEIPEHLQDEATAHFKKMADGKSKLESEDKKPEVKK